MKRFITRFFLSLSAASLTISVLAKPTHVRYPTFRLNDPGTENLVAYETYGVFTNEGTPQYRYLIKDRPGLSKAVGEGIYPNVEGLQKDPAFRAAKKDGSLEGPVWEFVNTDDHQLNFFKWASSNEPGGLRQFFAAMALERAGLIPQAIKAYQACVVHFPKTIGTTFWKTPWYVGAAAADKVAFLTRSNPKLKLMYEGARIRIKNRYDESGTNDIFHVSPGRIVPFKKIKQTVWPDTLSTLPLKREIGKGKVRLRQYENGHWQLVVDEKPFIIRAMAYSPTPIGKSPDDGSTVHHRDWMIIDTNGNGKVDGLYDSFVDKNFNNKQDSNEPTVGDAQLLKDMGVNTIRLYHHGHNKELLMDLYKKYGIRVVVGDFLGAYAVGSGANWNEGTDYSDPQQQKKMLESVMKMVEQYKDEPYVLFWVLGNENNYGVANNSRVNPKAYYEFVNRVAKQIKAIDPNHPVAICNGDLLFLDQFAKLAPNVDIFGVNAYRGDHGFGDGFWQDIADEWGKPTFITEFGCPAYHHGKSDEDPEEVERLQDVYLRNNWFDIERNLGGNLGVGNSLGGVVFEWIDEWWKAGPPPQYNSSIQDITGQFGGPFPDGWSYEEWFGLISQGNGENSPFVRQLRKAYHSFKNELWNAKEWASRHLPE